MRRLTLAVVLVLLVSAVMLGGCQMIAQKATEAAVEKATGVKVDTNKGTISATDEQGNTTELSASEGSYPEGFPSDFPQYAGATVDSALKSSKDGKDAYTVILTTSDATKDVYSWYLGELEGNGWTIDNKMDGTTNDSAFGTITAVKGDVKAGLTASEDKEKGVTSVMIGLGPKE